MPGWIGFGGKDGDIQTSNEIISKQQMDEYKVDKLQSTVREMGEGIGGLIMIGLGALLLLAVIIYLLSGG